MSIEIAIIICNYNKKEYLQQCVESVLSCDLKADSYELVVVDNASQDGAPEMLKAKFSDKVTLIENQENLGGSGGFATGINYYLEKKYPYLVLLDNDIRLEPDTISQLRAYLESNPSVGIVGSKICTMDNPNILQEQGSFIDFTHYNAQTPLKGHIDNETLPEYVSCDYVPACSLMSKLEVVEKIGNFDRKHFIYWDDMDWCTRAKEVGYEIHAINASRVFHKMGAVNLVNTFSNYYFERNRIYFFLKHISFDAISSFTDTIASEIINITYFAYHKGQHSNAISMLTAIDDVERDFFFKQDKHILPKEQITPLSSLHLLANAPAALILSGNLHHDRNIFHALQQLYGKNLTICSSTDYETLSRQFPGYSVCALTDIEPALYEAIFHATEHLSLFKISSHQFFSNSIIIDWYLNAQKASNIETFLSNYNTYKNIYLSIFKPVLQRKMELIHKRIHKSLAE